MLARCPICFLRVFGMYKKVADSGDVVIEKQGFSIVDTHGSAIAISLPTFCLHAIDSDPHRNQTFLVGRHQEVRRFVSPHLHHIALVSNHCGMSHNNHERHTSTLFCSFLLSTVTILCHQQAFRRLSIGFDRVVRKWWTGEDGNLLEDGVDIHCKVQSV